MNILPALEEDPESNNNSETRNMTIILKSDRPVVWKIRSDRVLGNLTIAAGSYLFIYRSDIRLNFKNIDRNISVLVGNISKYCFF